MSGTSINIQGHRGARGLYPENTITAFIGAVKLGVHTLEMDVVITADKQVLVSHEAWMNSDFCSLPNGEPVTPATQPHYNLYAMTYAEIKMFDCGKNGNDKFPFQKKIPEHKPLLHEVFIAVENYILQNNLEKMFYNIEIKTEINTTAFNPEAKIFVDLVHEVISDHGLSKQVSIQSFDVSVLQALNKKNKGIKTGLLVENTESLSANLKRLGYIPTMYNPEFTFVDQLLVKEVHELGMQLIPWTVNEPGDIKKMIALHVDGIITDYPDRLIHILNAQS